MLRPGNVHSADVVLDFIGPIVKRYRAKFRLFWLRGDAAFADSEGYKYCEREQVTYFIRLPGNEILKKLARAAPAGGPSSQVGGQGVGLPLPGQELGQAPGGGLQGSVAHRGAVPEGGLHRDQLHHDLVGGGQDIQWPG
jgi:hypothetical protein